MQFRIKNKKLQYLFCFLIVYLFVSYGLNYLIKIDFFISEDKLGLEIYEFNTSQCKIYHINPYGDLYWRFTWKFGNTSIPCNDPQNLERRLVLSNDTHLYINKNNTFKRKYGHLKLDCYYQAFWRKIPKNVRRSDLHVEYSLEHIFFNDSIAVKDEFVKVFCVVQKRTIFLDYHAFVPLRKVTPKNGSKRLKNSIKKNIFHSNLSKRINPQKNIIREKLNPIIFGLDAVSKHYLYYQMPKTVDYLLNELGAVEFLGYHKVGRNTFPNLMPVFTGKSEEQIYHDYGLVGKTDKFDILNLIWNDFQKQGYTTLFAEENLWMGLFNYQKKGFFQQPTTHYYGPFTNVIEEEMGENGLNTKLCIGDSPAIMYFLKYALKFLRTYQKAKVNFFATFWETSITHDFYLYDTFDETFENFVREINATGVLNQSILFFMSDHGSLSSSDSGYMQWIDARSPFLFVIVPEWFRQKYKWVMKNLEDNTRRIVSPFDLHETLRTILNGEFLKIEKKNYSNVFVNKIGMSLFNPIPETRTCHQAGIPLDYCKCDQFSKDYSETRKEAKHAANFAIDSINEMISDIKNCSKLHLQKILDARIHYSEHKKVVGYNVYKILFETYPGNGIFESVLNCRDCEKEFQISEIKRKNFIPGKSSCNEELGFFKEYCFCKDKNK